MVANINWIEHETLLREKTEEGLTASAIAKMIPGATKASVCGARRRFGLSSSHVGVHSKIKPEAAKAPPKSKIRDRAIVVAKKVAAPAEVTPARHDPKPLKGCPFQAPADVVPLAISELKAPGLPNGTCRWPYDGKDGEVRYCGGRTDGSFCETHHQLAYVPHQAGKRERAG